MLKGNSFKSRLLTVIAMTVTPAAFAGVARCQDTDSSARGERKAPMPEYIQEFFLAEAVRSQDKSELQATFAFSRQRIGSNADVQVEYGLTNRLQVNFETPYGITAGQNAEIPAQWSLTTAGVLYQIIRSNRRFALSAGMAFGLPIRSRVKLAYRPSILAAKTFGKVQIHASLLSDVEEWKPSLEYNLACVFPTEHGWFPTVEFNGRRLNANNAFYATPGLYRRFRHRIEMGIGIPLGIGGVAGSMGVVGKMNWEVGGER
jgi:hypothetical protein